MHNQKRINPLATPLSKTAFFDTGTIPFVHHGVAQKIPHSVTSCVHLLTENSVCEKKGIHTNKQDRKKENNFNLDRLSTPYKGESSFGNLCTTKNIVRKFVLSYFTNR